MSILDSFKKGKKKENEEKQIKKSEKLEVSKDKKVKEKGKKPAAKIYSNAYRVISNPTISEKATYLTAENKYVFEINKKADKKEVSQAVKDIYGVDPVKVNIVNIGGKARRYGKYAGKTSGRKKAIVTLKSGQNIQVYEGV